MEGLLAILLSERMGAGSVLPSEASRSPEVEALRSQIRQDLQATRQERPATGGEPAKPKGS